MSITEISANFNPFVDRWETHVRIETDADNLHVVNIYRLPQVVEMINAGLIEAAE